MDGPFLWYAYREGTRPAPHRPAFVLAIGFAIILILAVAAALAEDHARHARRPPAAAETASASEWASQARRDGLR